MCRGEKRLVAETKGVEVEHEFPTVCVVGKVGRRSYCKQYRPTTGPAARKVEKSKSKQI
jgi:hypothetical protein